MVLFFRSTVRSIVSSFNGFEISTTVQSHLPFFRSHMGCWMEFMLYLKPRHFCDQYRSYSIFLLQRISLRGSEVLDSPLWCLIFSYPEMLVLVNLRDALVSFKSSFKLPCIRFERLAQFKEFLKICLSSSGGS